MNKKIAFLGPVGTNSEEASILYQNNAQHIPFTSIQNAISAVESGKVNEAIVPIENSLEGIVTTTIDLLIHESTLKICNEVVLPISHHLITDHETKLNNIDTIYSHPQALAQCRSFLSKNYPNANCIASLSTATAVQDMLKDDRNAAAIASHRAAGFYGAKAIKSNIEDNPNNATRFIVLSQTDHIPTQYDKTSIAFSFNEDSPGLLHLILLEFASRKINLSKIESRPSKQLLGQYVFLIDFEGHRKETHIKETLENILNQVSILKIFGSYPRYVELNTRN